MYLLGTTIDYVKEDYSKNIFESKFVYIPDKDKATSCGCGVSFNPKPFQVTVLVKNKFTSQINSIDIYIMTEKTTGYDWRYSSKYTLRHAAVGEKYMTVSKKNKP